jgi:signal transduction histidine kinase
LVEDLRTLSLADAGELVLHRGPLSPKTLLERVVAAYGHRAEQQDTVLRMGAGPDVPQVHVDAERMAQVLGNLVSNALRHTPVGGQITLSAGHEAQANDVELVVQDTGVGIAPEALPRVFDRFYRADASRQEGEGESGLGLAIAKSIVEAHGGAISVASQVGRGTAFTIALPVA